MEEKIRVACAGDSIVYGYGIEENREIAAWPQMMRYFTDCSRFEIENFGICGSAAGMITSVPYARTLRFQQSLDYKPDIVFLMLGTNDAAGAWNEEEYRQGMTQIIHAYQNHKTKPEVILLTSPEVFKDRNSYGICRKTLDTKLIPSQRAIAASCGISCIDIYESSKKYGEHFPDGVHPDETGNYYITIACAEIL